MAPSSPAPGVQKNVAPPDRGGLLCPGAGLRCAPAAASGSQTVASNPTPPAPERVLSLDALRGFDMFWIIGGREVLKTWARWLDSPWYDAIDHQFQHVPWEGFV